MDCHRIGLSKIVRQPDFKNHCCVHVVRNLCFILYNNHLYFVVVVVNRVSTG
jgi:hypothetical protein